MFFDNSRLLLALLPGAGPVLAFCLVLGATIGAQAQSPQAATACASAPIGSIDPAIIENARRILATRMMGLRHNTNPVPLRLRKEDASIQFLVRASDLIPQPGWPRVSRTDVLFGRDYASDIERFVLPSDQRLLCLLLPGTNVFLSDGVTHHYAMVEAVDRGRGVVRLLDPWARQSFLRPGANVLGVRGTVVVVEGEPPRIELSLTDAVQVIKGLLSPVPVRLFADSVAALYPTEARSPAFFVWKYSRMVTGSSFGELAYARLEIWRDPMSSDLADLLANMLQDLTSGPPRSSGSPPSQDDSIMWAAFERRLQVYAVRLPWIVSWRIARFQLAVGSPADAQRTLAVLARAKPDDIDLQILRLAHRLRVERAPVHEADLDRLERLWRRAVYDNVVGENEEDAVRYFRGFEHPGGTPALEVNWVRRARIDLLRWTSALLRAEPLDVSAQLSELIRAYPGDLKIQFFPELLDLFDIADGVRGVTSLVELSFPNSAPNVSRALARQFEEFVVTRRSVASLTRGSSAAVRTLISNALCTPDEAQQGLGRVIYPGERQDLREDLVAWCTSVTPRPLAAPTSMPIPPVLPRPGSASQSLVVAYEARLGPRDRVNSNGIPLSSVAQVVRQDRANFHHFRIRDPEDQADTFFSTPGNRALLEGLIAHPGSTVALSLSTLDANPLVRVELWRGPDGYTIRVQAR